VPIAGTQNKVWLFSGPYDSPEISRGFLDQRSFQGALSELRNLNDNLESFGFEHDVEEIYQKAKDDLLIEIPDGALVILSEIEPRDKTSIYWYSPIEGSNGVLYLELTDSIKETFRGELIGMLEPWTEDVYSQLFEFRQNVVMPGSEKPERLGLIDWTTAAQFNQKNRNTLRGTAWTSLICVPIAVVLFWLKRRSETKGRLQ
jgi:hypothetical protein